MAWPSVDQIRERVEDLALGRTGPWRPSPSEAAVAGNLGFHQLSSGPRTTCRRGRVAARPSSDWSCALSGRPGIELTAERSNSHVEVRADTAHVHERLGADVDRDLAVDPCCWLARVGLPEVESKRVSMDTTLSTFCASAVPLPATLAREVDLEVRTGRRARRPMNRSSPWQSLPHAERPSDATTTPRTRTSFRTFSPFSLRPAHHCGTP